MVPSVSSNLFYPEMLIPKFCNKCPKGCSQFPEREGGRNDHEKDNSTWLKMTRNNRHPTVQWHYISLITNKQKYSLKVCNLTAVCYSTTHICIKSFVI